MVLGLMLLAASGCVTGKDVAPDSGLQPDRGDRSDQARRDGPRKDLRRADGLVPGQDGGGPPADGPAPQTDGRMTRPGWARIPAGTFWMGSPGTDACRDPKDETRHQVTLRRSIEMMVSEVTQTEFSALMGRNPSQGKEKVCGLSCPVGAVTWHEAAAYCNKLSKAEVREECYVCTESGSTVDCIHAVNFAGGPLLYNCKGYRLPTDAEWERAYRAGADAQFHNGNEARANSCSECTAAGLLVSQIGWYCGNSGDAPHPPGGRLPNGWGVKDMAGNLREWVDDWYHADLGTAAVVDPWRSTPAAGATKVLRGGYYLNTPAHLRAAARESLGPTSSSSGQYEANGFRCVRTLP